MGHSRIETLDSVRGVAAAVVLVHHALMLVPVFSAFYWADNHADLAFSDQPFTWLLFFTPLRLLWGGQEAVILFFVLSGFVLSLPWIEDRPPRYLSFLTKRLCRLYLPFVAAAALSVLLLTLVPHQESDANLLLHSGDWNDHHVTMTTVVDYVFMLGAPGQQFVNKVTWSLVHEMRISFLFPLLIVPIVRGRRLGAEALLLSLYTVSVLLPPSPSWLAPVSETLFLAIYFVLGALLAQNAERVRAALARWPAMGRAVFLGAGLVLTWGPSQHFHNIVSALGACIVIAAALSPGRIERFLMLPSLRWLGKISYSLYLVHVPVLLTVYYLARDRVPLPIIALAAVPLALLAAAAFHRLIEAPAMRLGHTLTRAKFPRLGEVGSAD